MEPVNKKPKALFRDIKELTPGSFQRFYDEIMAEVRASNRLGSFSAVSIGTGVNALRADKDGIWLGSEKIENAPFKVDMYGNVTLNSISNIVGVDTSDEVDAKISISKDLIESAVASTYATQTALSVVQQTATELAISIGRTGGVNLVKNSVGAKGTITEWQEYDEDGVLVDARNTATIVQDEDVIHYTESKSALQISNQFIKQTLETIIGTVYTIYCRFEKNSTLTLTITGPGSVEVTTDGYISGAWATFSYQFTATTTATLIQFENTSGTATISDIIVKQGEANGWQPAPTELLGKNFRFDDDGFRISSPNNNIVSQHDEDGWVVADISAGDIGSGNEIRMLDIDKNRASVNNLVANTSAVFQRYNNSSSALRITPVSDGVIFTIND